MISAAIPPLKPLLDEVAFNPDGTFTSLDTAKGMLDFMVRHDTGSSHDPALCKSNVPFVKALQKELDALGIKTAYREDEYPPDSNIMHASLVARMGPENVEGGVVLSSHTDVIPVSADDRKHWHTEDPFKLSEEIPGRLTARGAVDMKQAIVNYMAIAHAYHDKQDELKKPVYLALSWGEEIGIMGAPIAARMLQEEMNVNKPDMIIVGEPTNEELVIGHKGASILRINIQGKGGHSGYPGLYINAGTYAARIALAVDELQKDYMQRARDGDPKYNDTAFDPPYPCVNAGVVKAGTAPNAVPDSAMVEILFRSNSKVSLDDIMGDLRKIMEQQDRAIKEEAAVLAERLGGPAAEVGVTGKQLCKDGVALPSQDVPAKQEMLGKIKHGLAELGKPDVKLATEAYGTDGGALAAAFPDATTVVYGTGCIKTQNAHNPDEYITPKQLMDGPRFPLRMIHEFCRSPSQSNTPYAWMMPTAIHGIDLEAQQAV